MKITLVTKTSHLIGGVETYLRDLLVGLPERGVEASFFSEEGPGAATRAEDNAAAAPWHAGARHLPSVSDVVAWKPDLLFVHGLNSPGLERDLISRVPSVFFAHNYDSTCISGLKRWSRPEWVACSKALGPACLAHYFVNGCGGKNPLTMVEQYRRRTKLRDNLDQYRKIVTHSRWMQQEYARHVTDPGKVARIPFLVSLENPPVANRAPSAVWRIGFLGRFETAKGGQVLIQAASALQNLSRPVEIWFMGEGSETADWKQLAARHGNARVSFRFWTFGSAVNEYLAQLHLLAVPSLWPEPFGRVGIEAAAQGVPSVAFALGGVEDWLEPLKTGVLVPLSAKPAQSFADGITTLLESGHLADFQSRARASTEKFSKAHHLNALMPLLESAVTG